MIRSFPLVTNFLLSVVVVSKPVVAFQCVRSSLELRNFRQGRRRRNSITEMKDLTSRNKMNHDAADAYTIVSSIQLDIPSSLPSSRRDFFQKANIQTATLLSSAVLLASPNKEDAAWALDTLKGISKQKLGGLSRNIRRVGDSLDELQRDLMQERWDLVEQYPPQLRSFVPLFTTYTDSAFPSEETTDKEMRVALRYEVGRLFASLEKLRQATGRRALDEAYIAYSEISLHYDRYLRVGGLYPYYDKAISLEPYFQGYNDALVYVNPKTDPAEVRDLIVLVQGPDKGKTGIMIGVYRDGSNKCVVKLDRFKGIREIKVVPRTWAAKRLGEQDPDDVFVQKA